MESELSFTCPLCQKTSHNPNDARNRYCGNCHVFIPMSSTTVENELRTMAHRVLNEAKKEMERDGAANHAFIIQEKDGKFRKFELPERAGELMNSGPAKDAIFAFMREYVRANEATGCIFVSEAWMSRSTKKAKGMSMEELTRLVKKFGSEELEKRGLLKRIEALVITAQSPETILTLTQPFERHKHPHVVTFGPLDRQEFPQAQFLGRQKMFGDLKPENLR